MGKSKGTTIVAGLVIAGLLGSNAYAFVQLDKEKDLNKETTQLKIELEKVKKELNVAKGYAGQSSEYASHEDIILSFNNYSATNRFHYKGNDYYVDISSIDSHTFDQRAKEPYIAKANLTILKDKMENNQSYIQNLLPQKLYKEFEKESERLTKEEHAGEEHSINDDHNEIVPKDTLVKMEKEAKKPFEIASWKDTLSFNIKQQSVFEPTNTIKNRLSEEFVKLVVLKDKGIKGDSAEVSASIEGDVQTIQVKDGGKTYTFLYDLNTKELKEK